MFNKIKFSIYWRVRELSERLNILFGNQYIIVYTMGKVGSTSIYYALKKIFGSKVSFIHMMDRAHILEFNKPFIKNNVPPHRYTMGLFAKKHLIDKSKPVSIISAVREPISRNISHFFEDFSVYNDGKKIKDLSIDKAIQNFIENYPHDSFNTWFKKEFTGILQLRLDDLVFDQDKKYAFLNKKHLNLLILRTDLDDDSKNKILNQFLASKKININIKNAHYQKVYHTYYSEFLKKIQLPKQLVDEVYSFEYVEKFFTKNEIESFRTKWICNK